MAYCRNCGREIQGSPKFCPFCGEPIKRGGAPKQRFYDDEEDDEYEERPRRRSKKNASEVSASNEGRGGGSFWGKTLAQKLLMPAVIAVSGGAAWGFFQGQGADTESTTEILEKVTKMATGEDIDFGEIIDLAKSVTNAFESFSQKSAFMNNSSSQNAASTVLGMESSSEMGYMEADSDKSLEEMWAEAGASTPENKPRQEQYEEVGLGGIVSIYDTVEYPNATDFTSWYIPNVLQNGIPSGVERLTTLEDVQGFWKGLIYYDPYKTMDSEVVQVLNFIIYGTEDNLTIRLRYYGSYIVATDESIVEVDDPNGFFNCKWIKGGGCRGTGPGSIRITDFYQQGNKQYAIGRLDSPDGVPAYVAMVRP